MFNGEATNINFIVFGLSDRDKNPRSTTLEASTLIITAPMQFTSVCRIVEVKSDSRENKINYQYVMAGKGKFLMS
jgi:hypothetical protein